MRKTKIVCTLGPAVDAQGVLEQLAEAGMNVARFNCSHGTHEEHRVRMDAVKELRDRTGTPLALMLDMRGPGVRVLTFQKGEVVLRKGQEFVLTAEAVEGNETRVSVSYHHLAQHLKENTRIVLDDGLIELTVLRVVNRDVVCRVENDGVLKNNKSLNIPDVSLDMEYISPKERKDIAFGVAQKVDFVAASFVRCGEDVQELRRLLKKLSAEDTEIIAKIENRQGLEHIDEILKLADGIMIARGDLGVEVPLEELPGIQKNLVSKAMNAGKIVITATQMLESMIHHPRPTRAEVSDVANAVFDGTSAVMLSGETSVGKFPVQVVQTMARIAEQAEKSHFSDHSTGRIVEMGQGDTEGNNTSTAIAHATCTTSLDLKASAIVAVTFSGFTARAVASFRPKTPILGVTWCKKTYYQLALSWGVLPILTEQPKTEEQLFEISAKAAARSGLCHRGDLITMTAGVPVGVARQSNTLRVHRMEERNI